MVRQAVLLQPELAFNFAKQWLETTICKPIDTGNRKFYCDQNTLVHVELIHIKFWVSVIHISSRFSHQLLMQYMYLQPSLHFCLLLNVYS